MVLVSAYHRPTSVSEALSLLGRKGVNSALLAGGTTLNPLLTDSQDQTREAVEVIDLQSTGLSGITTEPGDDATVGVVVLGATATLADVHASRLVPAGLCELARREQPSTLRTLSTVGGTVGACRPDSEFVAGLLALQATVRLQGATGASSVGLAELVASPQLLVGSVLTGVSFRSGGTMESRRTARTPMDRPIVSVVGHRATDGTVVLAATGIAPTPIELLAGAELDPPSDFQGSGAYRTSLLRTNAARVAELLAN